MLVAKWFHLVGMILFVGCGLAAFVANHLAREQVGVHLLDGAQRRLGRLADLGSVFLWVSGFVLLKVEGFFEGGAFGKAGWVQMMITFALIAVAVSGIAAGKSRRMLRDKPDPRPVRKTLATLRLIFLISAIGAVTCGVWRFYW